MKETGLTGKRRLTTIAATPDDGKGSASKSHDSSLSVDVGDNYSATKVICELSLHVFFTVYVNVLLTHIFHFIHQVPNCYLLVSIVF